MHCGILYPFKVQMIIFFFFLIYETMEEGGTLT